jgi:hypothetical protein
MKKIKENGKVEQNIIEVNKKWNISWIKQKIYDYLTNNKIEIDDDGYRTHYYRCGLTLDPFIIEYDWKFKIHRTHQEIKDIILKLIKLLENKTIDWFKLKNNKTPNVDKYKDVLPPIFVFCKNRKKEWILNQLQKIWKDREWIKDNRWYFELEMSKRWL